MRVAVVHEWLTTNGGSEKVLEAILRMFPSADVFCLVDFLPDKERYYLRNHKVQTSFIQGLPFARKNYRMYLPLMPIAIEQFNLTSYDLVISSSHAVAKGVITGPSQTHVCYCHSPMRYAWDMQFEYLEQAGLTAGIRSGITRMILHYMRMWDSRTANGVDAFVANSNFVGERIRKCYGRNSVTVYPPIDLSHFRFSPEKEDSNAEKEDFYLAASRFVSYKRIDLIVEAFRNMPSRRLVVVGDGPDLQKIKAKLGPNTKLVGRVPREQLASLMRRAKAFVFAAYEDFGIVPLEAQACGTPVIAYGRGGALETVQGPNSARPTGVFFQDQSVAEICDSVEWFERNQSLFTPENCRRNALQFSEEIFATDFRRVIDAAMQSARGSDKSTYANSRVD